MAITGMNHFTVLTTDLDKSKAFYVGLLGLTEGYRPPFEFPGAWLYCGDQAILHIMAGRPIPATIHLQENDDFTAVQQCQVVFDHPWIPPEPPAIKQRRLPSERPPDG